MESRHSMVMQLVYYLRRAYTFFLRYWEVVVITRSVCGNSNAEKRTQMPLMKSYSSTEKISPCFPFHEFNFCILCCTASVCAIFSIHNELLMSCRLWMQFIDKRDWGIKVLFQQIVLYLSSPSCTNTHCFCYSISYTKILIWVILNVVTHLMSFF